MSKLNDRLTLVANLSVVIGIVFLAVQVRQNTRAIQSQTRDAITEKQMEYAGWIATDSQLADVFRRGQEDWLQLEPTERVMFALLLGAMLREGENSHYQYERGLFSESEYEARWVRWERLVAQPGVQQYWSSQRDVFSPAFRAEIDRIVAGLEQGP
jgi:hypothetical protein